MGSLWSKVTSMFRSQPEATGPEEQIEREILSLRNLASEILRADPVPFFGAGPVLVEPLNPGERFNDQEIDFWAIRVTLPDDSQVMVNIQDAYYKLRPDLTAETVKDHLLHRAAGWAQMFAANDLSWEEAVERFLPRLADDLQPTMVGIPWGDLKVRLVLDSPTHVTYINDGHLQGWGHTVHEAMTHAILNLRRRFGTTGATPIPPERTPGLRAWEVRASDPDINASMILLPEVTNSLPIPREAMFVLIPERNGLMFIERPAEAESRRELVTYVAQRCWGSDLPISPYLLSWSNSGLVRASAEEIRGYTLYLFEPDEPQAGADAYIVPHPVTGEEFRLVYPHRPLP